MLISILNRIDNLQFGSKRDNFLKLRDIFLGLGKKNEQIRYINIQFLREEWDLEEQRE